MPPNPQYTKYPSVPRHKNRPTGCRSAAASAWYHHPKNLVVDHSDYDGYIRFSFSRAITVVKRQLTVALAKFRRCSQAADFRRTVEMAGMR